MVGQHMHELGGLSLFWGVVVFLAVYLLLTFFNPDYVQREDRHGDKTGENDQAVTMLYTLVIVALIALLLWVLYWAFSCAW